MRPTVTLLMASLLIAGCGSSDPAEPQPAAAETSSPVYEALDTMMFDMDEPERADFCQAAADEGRQATVDALRTGWESTSSVPFDEDAAAEVVWDWCTEIESDDPTGW